ncbi:MAG: hypothetical protein ACC645_19635 [Pirellulales bacterium]
MSIFISGPSWADAEIGLSIESPRWAFYRGEEILLVVKSANRGEQSIVDAVLSVELADCVRDSATIEAIPAGQEHRQSFRLPTLAVKSGEYDVRLSLSDKSGTLADLEKRVVIAPKPKPDRLLIWLWGGSGNQWYLDHGFGTWAGIWRATMGRSYGDQQRRALDTALPTGAAAGIGPNGGLRDVDPSKIDDPDAANLAVREHSKGKIANPFHPEVARLQNEANRRMMEFVKDYPQVKTAFFNTEVVDQLGNNRNKAGLDLTEETLGFGEDELGEPTFVAPGVIADDDRRYLFHKYKFKQGNGLALANQRAADMIHRYRPDIITINDPYRYTSVLDMFPGVDVISTWTYTKPDPKLMLYVETLRAACRPTGQIPLHTITLLNYPGTIAPTEEWMLMGPGRVAVTSWINLSRAPKMMGYYYSSACPPPGEPGAFRVPYETSLQIKELAEKVYKPYGPMITNLEIAPRRIAILSSAASIVHRAERSLYGYPNTQIYHFYTVMAMAHLQADVVFDETIERFGLDEYDVLVLAQCDTLTKTVYDQVLRFRKRGGIVIADQFLRADVPGAIRFDFDFTYRKKVSADAIVKNETYAEWNDHLQPDSAEMSKVQGITALDDQKFMEAYAARLKKKLAGTVDPDIDCDSPKVLFNMLERGSVSYLVAINDNRTYDERVGQYKAVLGQLLPQSTTVRIKRSGPNGLFAYDMLERKPLEVSKTGDAYEFSVHLTELGGKIVALYPRELGSLEIKTAKAIKRGATSVIRISMRDDSGAPPSGLQPLEVTITDAEGARSEFSGYYCASDGVLNIDFIAALNDEPARWTVSAVDLTAGLTAQSEFEVVK